MNIIFFFLVGDLDKKVYMENLRGLLLKDKTKKIYKFVKSLYNLQQAHKPWYEKFNKVMFLNEFKINKVDKHIYIKNKDKVYVIIFLCMDDMLILDNNDHMIMSIMKM